MIIDWKEAARYFWADGRDVRKRIEEYQQLLCESRTREQCWQRKALGPMNLDIVTINIGLYEQIIAERERADKAEAAIMAQIPSNEVQGAAEWHVHSPDSSIYIRQGERFIAGMESREMAERIVRAHNATIMTQTPSDDIEAAADRWIESRFEDRTGTTTERTVISVMREGFEAGYRAAFRSQPTRDEVERLRKTLIERDPREPLSYYRCRVCRAPWHQDTTPECANDCPVRVIIKELVTEASVTHAPSEEVERLSAELHAYHVKEALQWSRNVPEMEECPRCKAIRPAGVTP